MFDGILFWHLALVLLGVASVIFIAQEAVPALLHHYNSDDRRSIYRSGTIPKLDRVVRDLEKLLPSTVPRICLLNSEDPVIYVKGLTDESINISRALIEALDLEELEAVLAHEICHVLRRDNAIGLLLFIIRSVMFFNPVVLVEFRRVVNGKEMVCDDLACSLTRKPLAVASGLLKVFRIGKADVPSRISKSGLTEGILSVVDNIERKSQKVRIENRVMRIVCPKSGYSLSYPNIRLALTSLSLILLLFFVV